MILQGRAVQRHQPTRPSLAQAVYRHHVLYGSSLGVGRQKFFCCEIPQGGVVEHGIGQKALEPGVFRLQGAQPPRIGDAHAPLLGLVLVESGVADAVFAADLGSLQPRLLFPDHTDDLLVR